MRLLLGTGGNSFLHRRDPRVKLAWLAGNLAVLIAFGEWWVALAVLAGAGLASAWARLPVRAFAPLIKIGLVISLQLALLQGALAEHGPVAFSLGGLDFLWPGIKAGARAGLLMTTLACLFLQFMMWTTPQELTLLLLRCGLGARYAVVVGLGLRFLPLLEKDLRSIVESLQSRGLNLAGPWRKVRHLPKIILPLLLRTLARAEAVAQSMELKAFGLHPERTWLYELSFRQSDALALLSMAAYFASLCLLA